MMPKKSPILLIAAAIASLLVSCGSMKNTATVHRTGKVGDGGSHDTRHFEVPKSLPPQSHALLAEAKKWIGTPYKYGGEDKRGVDCSGLVLNVYKSALDIKLPRNSAAQSAYCSPLGKDMLMPGDLIFFATSGSKNKVSHVGIYVGDGKMIHSSASKGVIVSNISDDYYKRTFAGAGYVEKYRAMITPLAPEKPARPTAAPTVPAENIGGGNNADSDTPFKMTPVKSLPQKVGTETKAASPAPAPTVAKTAGTTDKNKPAPQPAKNTKKTIATVGSSQSSSSEPDPDEARKAVLNSLIEQKLDSIFKQ